MGGGFQELIDKATEIETAVDGLEAKSDTLATNVAGVAAAIDLATVELATIDTNIATLAAKAAQDAELKHGTGDGVAKTAFTARNTTAASDTTYREIKAAVASKRHWIHWIEVTNITPAETPVINVSEDTGGTPVVRYTTAPGDPAVVPSRRQVFEPPIVISSGVNIGVQATTATGDTHVTIGGFVED